MTAASVLVGCGVGGGDAGPGEAGLLVSSASPDAPGSVPGITAQGVGRVEGRPDVVTAVLGVQTAAPTAAQALADGNRRATALLDLLRQRGVEDRDVQTSEVSLYPTQTPEGKVTGYQVSNTVTVTVRRIDEAGPLVDAAASAAGDAIRIQSVRFSFDDTSELLARARDDAVRRGREQAARMAAAAEVELGPLRSIVESPPPGYGYGGAYESGAGSAAAASVPLRPGTQELTVRVSVVYDVQR